MLRAPWQKVMLTWVAASVIATARCQAAENWSCYDPQPGHPTVAEKSAFAEEVKPFALEAERRYGVPAPAIAAMSIIESGYGFTRTALEANNLFGFKWTDAASAGGRGYYELTCQPDWDPGKKYIKFESRGAAIAFVAQRLANSKYYKPSTGAFRQSMLRKDNRDAAVIKWVSGISDPYNYQPAAYARSIVRIMNDPLEPSDQRNMTRSLFLWQ
jgi:uncharacterized FlgJ-related protein